MPALSQEDLCALKALTRQHPAVAALPQSYISSNDVVVAITWMLSCDMHQRPKPGHAPPGSANLALLVLDLLGNDTDGLLTRSLVPPGDHPVLPQLPTRSGRKVIHQIGIGNEGMACNTEQA